MPERAGGCLQAGPDAASQLAAVEIIETVAHQQFQGFRKCEVPEQLTGNRDPSARHVQVVEPDRIRHLIVPCCGVTALTGRYGKTVFRVEHGIFEQAGKWQTATPGPADFEGALPAGNRARYREGGTGTTRRYRRIAVVEIVAGVGGIGSASAGIDTSRLTAGGVEQPEVVTAQTVHVRVHDGDSTACCQHCLDGIATFGKHALPRARGEVVRRRYHTLVGTSGLQH